MALHGDAVPVARLGKAGSKSMEPYSTPKLLAIGETKVINTLNVGLFTNTMYKRANGTMYHIWLTMLWSLSIAILGVWPTQDAYGNDFPAGSKEAEMA